MTPVSAGFGGAEIMAANYTRYFAEKGADSFLCFEQSAAVEPLVEHCKEIGVRSLHPPIKQPEHSLKSKRYALGLIAAVVRTAFFLFRQKPDAIQIVLPCPTFGLHLLLAARIMRVPANIRFALVTEEDKKRICGKIRQLYRWAFGGPQAWNALSNQNRRLVGEIYGVDSKKIDMVYNAYFPREEVADEHRAALLKKQMLEKDRRVLLAVGRLAVQKGCSLVLDVLPPLFRKYDDLVLVWVGDGELRGEMDAFVRMHELEDRFLLLGRKDDVIPYFKMADLFVFPTLYEGCPAVLFEAIHAGCPVITSDASGIPELVTHGKHALLFQTANSADFYARIEEALEDPERMQRMAKAAKKEVLGHLTPEAMFLGYDRIFNKLL